MNEQAAPAPELGIPAEDWEKTPASVRAIVLALYPLWQAVAELKAENQVLKAEVAQLREQVQRNSGNSSQPPSSDGPGKVVQGKPQPRADSGAGSRGIGGRVAPCCLSSRWSGS